MKKYGLSQINEFIEKAKEYSTGLKKDRAASETYAVLAAAMMDYNNQVDKTEQNSNSTSS